MASEMDTLLAAFEREVSAPRFDNRRLPEAEHIPAWELQLQLQHLSEYVQRFEADLALLQHSTVRHRHLSDALSAMRLPDDIASMAEFHSKRTAARHGEAIISEWLHIACRDGAMTIFHFGKTIDAINGTLPKCPTIMNAIPRPKLKEPNSMLRDSFPRFEAMRHSVGHEAEFVNSPRQREAHSFTGTYDGPQMHLEGTVFVGGVLENDRYIFSFEGKIVSYDINQASLNALGAIRDVSFSNMHSTNLTWDVATPRAGD